MLMKRPNARLATMFGAVALSLGLICAAAPANAATVLNRFERSCNFTCSPFVQVNGTYQPSVGSNCVTTTWFVSTSSYTLPPGHRC
jgi:hypothetical protein